MLTLFHHPFCPHSRFIRLALGECGMTARLVEERVWERREEFLALNPAGETPVLVSEGHPPVPGAAIIAEYLDEIAGNDYSGRRLLPRESDARVEVRRLTSWFQRRRLRRNWFPPQPPLVSNSCVQRERARSMAGICA